MTIRFFTQTDSNLSQTDLEELWNQPPALNDYKLTSDYIARGQNADLLFQNDAELQRQIDDLQGQVDSLGARLTIVEGEIVALDIRVTQNETDIDTNAENIAINTADIATNAASISANASDIAAISTPSGSGSPEGVVMSTRTQIYIDTSGAPDIYFNPAIGSNTGWLLVSSSG